jgi:hypothetical protein
MLVSGAVMELSLSASFDRTECRRLRIVDLRRNVVPRAACDQNSTVFQERGRVLRLAGNHRPARLELT